MGCWTQYQEVKDIDPRSGSPGEAGGVSTPSLRCEVGIWLGNFEAMSMTHWAFAEKADPF